jgi:hypothetical protein
MGVTRTRLAVLMAMLVWTFGCKGAGQALRVAGVVAVTAVRVAAVVAAAEQGHHRSHEREASDEREAPPAPPVGPAPIGFQESPTERSRCVPTADSRTLTCGKHVIVQDERSGLWRERP